MVNLIFARNRFITGKTNSPIIGEPNGSYPVTIGGSTKIDIVTEDLRDIGRYREDKDHYQNIFWYICSIILMRFFEPQKVNLRNDMLF